MLKVERAVLFKKQKEEAALTHQRSSRRLSRLSERDNAGERGERLNEFSLRQLARAYKRYHRKWPLRIAAEAAFALAVAVKREADRMGDDSKNQRKYMAMARRYAKECLMYAERLPSSHLPDVAPMYTSLAGVTMPNYFYIDYLVKKESFPDFSALLN